MNKSINRSIDRSNQRAKRTKNRDPSDQKHVDFCVSRPSEAERGRKKKEKREKQKFRDAHCNVSDLSIPPAFKVGLLV